MYAVILTKYRDFLINFTHKSNDEKKLILNKKNQTQLPHFFSFAKKMADFWQLIISLIVPSVIHQIPKSIPPICAAWSKTPHRTTIPTKSNNNKPTTKENKLFNVWIL